MTEICRICLKREATRPDNLISGMCDLCRGAVIINFHKDSHPRTYKSMIQGLNKEARDHYFKEWPGIVERLKRSKELREEPL